MVSGWGGGASVEEKEEGTGERGRAGEKKVSFSKSFFLNIRFKKIIHAFI